MKQKLNKAWKNAEMNNKDIVEINKDLMMQIHGGEKSAGYICSVSGECNTSGKSCGKGIGDAIESIWDTIFN